MYYIFNKHDFRIFIFISVTVGVTALNIDWVNKLFEQMLHEQDTINIPVHVSFYLTRG